jgi:hypothetical protein
MTWPRRTVLIACALASLVSLALIGAPASASAADSLAPRGAAHNWLPKEGWVWMHWLPFEEPELATALGTSAAGIRSYLSDDTRTLATLAHRRHWRLNLKALARHLTRRFDGRVPKRRLGALRWRTERMLTQGHLAQHVLYHTFHGPAVPAHAEQLFGITRDVFLAARQQGFSPIQLALRVGRNPRIVRAGALQVLKDEAQQGIASRSQSRSQARRMLSRQTRDLDCWMASPLPKLDPNNPFGGRDGDHGHGHAPRIPGCNGSVTALHTDYP